MIDSLQKPINIKQSTEIMDSDFFTVGLKEWENNMLQEFSGFEIVINELFYQIKLCLVKDITKGALLVGSSGMGKSYLVKKLQDFSPIDCQIFQCGALIASESEHSLRNKIRLMLYPKSSENTYVPRLIILDDIDLLVSSAGNSATSWLSHWLSSFESSKNILTMVIGVASNVSQVPESWRVSGRLSGKIGIFETNFQRRKTILNSLLSHFVSSDMDCQALATRLASSTPYLAPVDLCSLVRKVFLSDAEKHILRKKSALSCESVADLEANLKLSISSLEEKLLLTLQNFIPAGMRAGLGEIKRQQATCLSSNSLDELFGLDSIIEELHKNLAVPLHQLASGYEEGLSVPRGIFLHGPPGVGKSLLCRAFASSLNCNVVFVDSTQLRSSIVGESEKAVSDMFDQARSNSPCILVLDQLDALLPPRGQTNTSEGSAERIVTSFLTELDGLFVSGRGSVVVVIGISNHPSYIDPAVLRPGRLDIHLHIPLPDPEQRMAILKGKLNTKNTLNQEELSKLVELSNGFSGADLENLCREAALTTLRNDINSKNVPYEAYLSAVTLISNYQEP